MKLAAMDLYVNLSSIDLFSCILSPEGTEGGGHGRQRLKSCSHQGVDTKSRCSFLFKSPWLFSVTKYLYIIECFWFVSETFLCDNDNDQLPSLHIHTKESRAKHEIRISVPCFYETPQLLPLLWVYCPYVSGLPFCSACFLHFLYKLNRNWECFWHWTTWFTSESEAIVINTTAKRKHELQSTACFALLCSRSLLKEAIPFENLAPDKNRDQEKEKKNAEVSLSCNHRSGN